MFEPPSPRRCVVFFDIGQVLLKYDPKEVAVQMAKLLRKHPMKVARYLWASNLVDRIERGRIKPREIYHLFSNELGFEGDYDEFKRLWSGFFKLHLETAAIFDILVKKHRVYLFSNTNFLHWDHIRRSYAFAKKARGAVLSFKLDLRKPDPAIYRYAVKYAGARPCDCVFIDDRIDNVETAVKLGLHGIRFSNADKLRDELEKIGLL